MLEFHCPNCVRYTETTARWLVCEQDLWCRWCNTIYQVKYKVVFSLAAKQDDAAKLARYSEFIEEVAIGSYSDSDPASLLDTLQQRAKAILAG